MPHNQWVLNESQVRDYNLTRKQQHLCTRKRGSEEHDVFSTNRGHACLKKEVHCSFIINS